MSGANGMSRSPGQQGGSPRRPPPHYPRDWPTAAELDRRPARYVGKIADESPEATSPRPGHSEREAVVLDAMRRRGPRLVLVEEAPKPAPPAAPPTADGYGPMLLQWELEQRGRMARMLGRLPMYARQMGLGAIFVGAAVLGGMSAVEHREMDLSAGQLRQRLAAAQLAVEAREGELALLRLELDRLRVVSANSARYRIPTDLAGTIYDIALAEGIDPELAYALIRVESGFYQRAVSPVGAVGLTQVMPSTAFELDPTLRHSDLFRRDTNLRLGFRYLRWLLDRYDGDLRIALLAYNRGPGTVDSIRSRGMDPANGYARAVMSWANSARGGDRAGQAASPAASRP